MKQARKKLKAKPSFVKKDPASGCYSFRLLRKFHAAAAFSSRRFQMEFAPEKNRSLVIAHRRHFCELTGVPFDRLVSLEQVHGANIVRVGERDAGKGSRSASDAIGGSDGVITADHNVVLSIRTADCAPLFFLDTRRYVIGMAHVGWRGASEHLAAKMVQAFRMQFLSKPGDLLAAVGPMIRACCYQVGEEFQGVFGSFVQKRNGGRYFDLNGWILDELTSEGVLPARIMDSGFCTVCSNDQFPSFRKEAERAGRTLSILALM